MRGASGHETSNLALASMGIVLQKLTYKVRMMDLNLFAHSPFLFQDFEIVNAAEVLDMWKHLRSMRTAVVGAPKSKGLRALTTPRTVANGYNHIPPLNHSITKAYSKYRSN